MNNSQNELDMDTELFITPARNMKYRQMPESKDYYQKAIRKEVSPELKQEYLKCLILAYRYETKENDGKYEADAADELIEFCEIYFDNSPANDKVGVFLMHEGSICEGAIDFEIAAKFYLASLKYEFDAVECKYLKLNSLGFCLNYLKRFEEAEKYLRKAVEYSPKQYNAWKNLGVSLEHMGQHEGALECYIKAIHFSQGEIRSKKHLVRLVFRHPNLRIIAQSHGVDIKQIKGNGYVISFEAIY